MITHPACEPQTYPKEGRPRACAEVALVCAVGEEVELSSESQVQQGAMEFTAPYGR